MTNNNNTKKVNSPKFGNEAIISTRNGTEGSNFHVRYTMTAPLLKYLAIGLFALLLVTARRCSPNLVLKDLFKCKACNIYCMIYSISGRKRWT